MIEVELPDGSIAEFPDGTPPDVMKGALQKRFGAPQQSAPEAPQPDQRNSLMGKVDTVMRGVADMASLGFADEIAAGLGTGFGYLGDYDKELAKQRGTDKADAEARGSYRLGGQLAGAVGVPMGAAKAVLGSASSLGGAAARSAIDGALLGGLYGAGSGEGIEDRIKEGTVGGLLGLGVGMAAPAVTKAISAPFAKKAAIPALEEINIAKKAAYDMAEKAGVIYTPKAVSHLSRNITDALTDMGFDPALQPGASAVVRRLQELEGQNVTMKGLDTLRKVASNGYIPGNKANNKAISDIINVIDDAMTKPSADDILMGDAKTGMAALMRARKLASQSAKLERVDNAVNRADLRAASTGSGGNADNATRQNLRRLLENPRGFTADEKSALEKIVRGTRGQNSLRLAGKLSPSGNGLMAALGVGGAMVNPMVGVASLGGMAAKSAADRMTQANVQGLLDIIAAGGTKAATKGAKTAAQKAIENQSGGLSKLLLGLGLPAVQN